ncbi:MAG: response regulator [Pseudomonadota bacterium]
MARILIADDDELIAELASEVLIDAGHACGWVTDAEAAWELLHRGRRPDVLLLDQNMPGMSGVTLLRKLRGSSIFYDLPVIMFTTMSGDEDEAQAIYAGAQEFVRKPFDAMTLRGRIERVLAKRGDRPQHKDLKTVMAESNGFVEPTASSARRLF